MIIIELWLLFVVAVVGADVREAHRQMRYAREAGELPRAMVRR